MMPGSKKKISRKVFFQRLGLILLLPLLYFWRSTVREDKAKHKQNRNIRLQGELPPGISFLGSAVLVNRAEAYALSTKCSHLGCTINELQGNELVCPCHGSRYNLQGEVIKGPAASPLKKLIMKKENDTTVIEI